MPLSNFDAQLRRLSNTATVLASSRDGTDDFGNPEFSYQEDRKIETVRTYPNRNTEIDESAGTRHRNRPVFLFSQPSEPHDPEPPGEDDRLRYQGTVYSMQARTEYDSHVEIIGSELQS